MSLVFWGLAKSDSVKWSEQRLYVDLRTRSFGSAFRSGRFA